MELFLILLYYKAAGSQCPDPVEQSYQHQPHPRAHRKKQYLALLGPQRGLQLATGQEPIFQTGQEGEEVPSLGEVQRRPLGPILTHQH